MDFLIGWTDYETQFMNKVVKMELRTLRRDASMVLMKHMDVFENMGKRYQAAQKKKLKNIKMSIDDVNDMNKLLNDFEPFFISHVRNISGITANEKEITSEVLIAEATFATLVMDIVTQLSINSKISKDEEKNSERPSDSQG